MRFTSTIAAGAVLATASAQNYLGFNSGATLADRSAKFKADFKEEFVTAARLNGAPGKFNSVRLYTNIQAYSEDDPIEAFDAAVETNTNILLGVWASGTDNIDKEITALKKALDTHGDDLADLIIGVTIGSEDLYRVSATGIKNKSGVGNSPKAIVSFIKDFRDAFSNGPLADIPVGHADTWDSWGNVTNKPVIDASDFIAVHEYPYYENDKGNDIDNAGTLFDRAYQVTLDAAGDKPVWVTETGWPYIGPDWDEAEASIANAKTYWDEVGCRKLFNKTPTFWYTLRDSNPDNEMKFAITDNLDTEPLFDLTCPDSFDTPTSTKSSSSPSSTSGSHSSDSSESTESSEPSRTSDSNDSSETETGSQTSTFASTSPSTTSGSGEDNTDGGSSGGNDSNESTTGTGTQDASNPEETSAASGLKMVSTTVIGLVAAAIALV